MTLAYLFYGKKRKKRRDCKNSKHFFSFSAVDYGFPPCLIIPHICAKWLAGARVGGCVVAPKYFPTFIILNYKYWPFPPKTLFAKFSESKWMASLRKVWAMNFRKGSWVYQELNFDWFYGQIHITTVRGHLSLRFFKTLSEYI